MGDPPSVYSDASQIRGILNWHPEHDSLTAIVRSALDWESRMASVIRSVPGPDNGLVRNRSEEHTSELQSLMRISYAVFCLKKQKSNKDKTNIIKTTTTV